MSAPNTVTLQNNSGDNFVSIAIYHAQGTVGVPPPGGFELVLATGPVNNGSTSAGGTATVADGLADWWIGGILNEADGQIYYISSSTFGDLPFKECSTPDNGSTIFEISPDSGSGFGVTIQTNESDGSSDGSCGAVAANMEEIGDSWAEFGELLGELLEEIAEALGGGELARTRLSTNSVPSVRSRQPSTTTVTTTTTTTTTTTRTSQPY